MVPFTPPSPNHMRALFHASHNQPRFHILPGTLPIPSPLPGQALIKVRAAAVTPNDVETLPHNRPLYIPGMALAGELLTDTTNFSSGTRVAAVCHGGAWAEFAVVSEKALWKIDTTFEEAAALASVISACLQGVRVADIKSGDLLVITGGVSAAGCVLSQIATLVYGARVILGVRGPSQVAVGELIPAEAVVDRETEKVHDRLGGETIDVGLDTTGEACKLAKIVKKGGKLVRVMPVGEQRAQDFCTKRGVDMIDVHARVDDKAMDVVRQVVTDMPIRAACGPIFGVARWLRALEAAERRVGAGCVVIMF